MAVQFIRISLRGYGQKNPIASAQWTQTWELKKNDTAIHSLKHGSSAWEASIITFYEDELIAYKSETEPNEIFVASIEAAFTRITNWLNQRSIEKLNDLRSNGVKIDIFIGLWIDNDQFDLQLPPAFLSACGRLDLKIDIISNN